jgi:hypothetical protein
MKFKFFLVCSVFVLSGCVNEIKEGLDGVKQGLSEISKSLDTNDDYHRQQATQDKNAFIGHSKNENRKVDKDFQDTISKFVKPSKNEDKKVDKKKSPGNPYSLNKNERASFCDVDWNSYGAPQFQIDEIMRNCKELDADRDSKLREFELLNELENSNLIE